MDYKELIIESGKKMFNEGFTIETWGNIMILQNRII